MEKLIRKPTCMQPLKIYTFDYPEMLQYEKLQMDNYWLPDEPRAENDTHELKTGLTDTEYHGVLTTLKLFTLYEIQVGNEYWGGRFKRMFPRPEFDRVASINAMTELNIHAPFYNKVNEILRLNTDEFYESYAQDPILKERMDFIEELCSSKNDLLSLALFSLIEGAVLYSNFAFLKHFQVNGKNKLSSIVSGINFSVRDENPLIGSTDVLTSDGWKNIKDVTTSDKVMQYDLETKEYTFVNPIETHTFITNTAVEFTSGDFHQVVTPNHRMVTTTGIVKAINCDGTNMIKSGIKKGDSVLDDSDKLMIKNIVLQEGDVSWIYRQINVKSSEWCKNAIHYYLKLIN